MSKVTKSAKATLRDTQTSTAVRDLVDIGSDTMNAKDKGSSGGGGEDAVGANVDVVNERKRSERPVEDGKPVPFEESKATSRPSARTNSGPPTTPQPQVTSPSSTEIWSPSRTIPSPDVDSNGPIRRSKAMIFRWRDETPTPKRKRSVASQSSTPIGILEGEKMPEAGPLPDVLRDTASSEEPVRKRRRVDRESEGAEVGPSTPPRRNLPRGNLPTPVGTPRRLRTRKPKRV